MRGPKLSDSGISGWSLSKYLLSRATIKCELQCARISAVVPMHTVVFDISLPTLLCLGLGKLAVIVISPFFVI